MKRFFCVLAFGASLFGADCGCPAEESCLPPEPWCPIQPKMECDYGVYIDGEFLYWYSQGNQVPYAIEMIAIPRFAGSSNNSLNIKKVHSFQVSWDPGARVGLGWKTPTYPWDLYLVWTGYYTSRNESVKVPTVPSISEGTFPVGTRWFTSGWLDLADIDIWESIRSKWSFRLNYFDLQMAFNSWAKRFVSLRPYIGLRGGWTFEELESKGVFRNTANAISDLRRVKHTQDFWGVGLLLGLDSAWHFTKNFAFFANASGALLWSKFDMARSESLLETTSAGAISEEFSNIRYTDTIHAIQPIIDLGMGLRWESFFSQNRYKALIDLGWEHHIWFTHTRLLEFDERETPPRGIRSNENVSIAGIVLRGRFDF